MLRRFRLLAGVVVLCIVPVSTKAGDASTETILFIRHGEKPRAGLGQLSCKGLNRALALAGRLANGFGRIDAIFAPNPSQQKEDGDGRFDYVRPLATVEPTAIRLGLPVHAGLGFADGDKLLEALGSPAYRNATVLVAWEHHAMQKLVPALLAATGGEAASVPQWTPTDFDSIWKITIMRSSDGRTTSTFVHDHQNLDGQPDVCPQ